MRMPCVDGEGLGAVVDQDHPDLAAIVAVDGAGAVEQRQPVAQRQARARAHLHLVARGERDGEAGRDQRALAGRERQAARAPLGRAGGAESMPAAPAVA